MPLQLCRKKKEKIGFLLFFLHTSNIQKFKLNKIAFILVEIIWTRVIKKCGCTERRHGVYEKSDKRVKKIKQKVLWPLDG